MSQFKGIQALLNTYYSMLILTKSSSFCNWRDIFTNDEAGQY